MTTAKNFCIFMQSNVTHTYWTLFRRHMWMAPGRWRPRQRKQVRESRIHSLSPTLPVSRALAFDPRSLSLLPPRVRRRSVMGGWVRARENRVREHHHEIARHSIVDEGAPGWKSNFKMIPASTHEAECTSPCMNKFFMFPHVFYRIAFFVTYVTFHIFIWLPVSSGDMSL